MLQSGKLWRHLSCNSWSQDLGELSARRPTVAAVFTHAPVRAVAIALKLRHVASWRAQFTSPPQAFGSKCPHDFLGGHRTPGLACFAAVLHHFGRQDWRPSNAAVEGELFASVGGTCRGPPLVSRHWYRFGPPPGLHELALVIPPDFLFQGCA